MCHLFAEEIVLMSITYKLSAGVEMIAMYECKGGFGSVRCSGNIQLKIQ
jgi:hypothetical protein